MVTSVGDGSIFIYPFVFRFLPRSIAGPFCLTVLPLLRSFPLFFFVLSYAPFLHLFLVSHCLSPPASSLPLLLVLVILVRAKLRFYAF